MGLRNYNNVYPNTTVVGGVPASTPGASETYTIASTDNIPTAPFSAAFNRGQNDEEAVLVTAVNTTTKVITVTRGYDGTNPQAHSNASSPVSFEHVMLALDLREANAHVNAGLAGTHGASGALMDTGSAQTVTGLKTLSGTAGERLVVDHTDSGGWSQVTFASAANRGSDFGFLVWDDDWSAAGVEKGRMVIGLTNDSGSDIQANPADHLRFEGSSRVVVNVGSTDARLASILTSDPTAGGTGNWVMEWRLNDSTVAHIDGAGNIVSNGSITLGGRFIRPTQASYGSFDIAGGSGGWGGLTFTDFAGNQTLMMSGTAFGVYDAVAGSWRMQWNGPNSGTAGQWALINGTVPWSQVTSPPEISQGNLVTGSLGAITLSSGTATTIWSAAVNVVSGRRYMMIYEGFDHNTGAIGGTGQDTGARFSLEARVNGSGIKQITGYYDKNTSQWPVPLIATWLSNTTGSVTFSLVGWRAVGSTATMLVNGGDAYVLDIGTG